LAEELETYPNLFLEQPPKYGLRFLEPPKKENVCSYGKRKHRKYFGTLLHAVKQ
jgi:hypothetical protein